jgi:hypothetical protein
MTICLPLPDIDVTWRESERNRINGSRRVKRNDRTHQQLSGGLASRDGQKKERENNGRWEVKERGSPKRNTEGTETKGNS